MSETHLTSIRFSLPVDSWHGYASESIWVESIDGERFRVSNTPFFVKGVSFDDVVAATLTPDGYVFERVVARGGHSTYRVIPQGTPDRVADALRGLKELGCTWEEGPRGLVALDVPPEGKIHQVFAALEAGARDSQWDFEEGHVGHEVELLDET